MIADVSEFCLLVDQCRTNGNASGAIRLDIDPIDLPCALAGLTCMASFLGVVDSGKRLTNILINESNDKPAQKPSNDVPHKIDTLH